MDENPVSVMLNVSEFVVVLLKLPVRSLSLSNVVVVEESLEVCV